MSAPDRVVPGSALVEEPVPVPVPAGSEAEAAKDRRWWRWAVAAFVAGMAMEAFGWVMLAVNGSNGTDGGVGGALVFDLPLLVFPITGIVVARRQPRNAVVWVLLGIGLAAGFGSVVGSYAAYGLVTNPGSLPGADVAAALNGPTWDPVIVPVATLLLLLFPDGRPPSKRWNWVLWLTLFAIAVVFLVIMVSPGRIADSIPGAPKDATNPIAVPLISKLLPVVLPLIPICMVLSVISLIVRFRHSRGIERLQLKWLATAAAIGVGLYALADVLSLANWGQKTDPIWLTIIQNLSLVAFLLIPVSIGLAILRYHLYDIDRIISRTVSYSLLTALLVGVYALIVVGIGTLTGRSENPVLIAGATLLVAAMFRPLRRRLQASIDRRLYRRRYDADRVLGAFASRLRDELDLNTLSGELQAAVSQTVQPAQIGVWIRHGRAPR